MKLFKALFLIPAILLLGAITVNAQCSHSSEIAYNNHNHGEKSDIVGLAAGSETLSTLVAAVKAADLVETLQGKGPFTVFAPTNEAFAALPDGTLEDLLKPENKGLLVKILTYHVVSGKFESTDLEDGQEVPSVEGNTINVKISPKSVKINNATVVKANLKATNGVVHVIDKVIMPAGI